VGWPLPLGLGPFFVLITNKKMINILVDGLGDPGRPALKPQVKLAGSRVICIAGSSIITLEIGFFICGKSFSEFSYYK